MTDDDHTALATLKERVANALDRLETVAEEMRADRKEFHEAVTELRDEITRYKGFIGGIAFVLSGIVTALAVFKGWLFNTDR
jgi:hypothetical protein